MINWGYTIQKDRQIDFDKNDKRIAKFVLEKEPTFKLCMACGTCTATCSAGNLTDFNIRKLNILLRRGEISEIKEEIDKCMFCGKCQLACPRGVKTRNVIFNIKKAIKKFKNEL
ncbi:MAG: (4Fe-4S)-binding protein [Euryarchaeota archaeon HGW-Euryarchaeota-1]|nr:MAG: (4Fe-4S)-binding protein [Euryarchaeota archaeon HGW-Euryarchaeota-1]